MRSLKAGLAGLVFLAAPPAPAANPPSAETLIARNIEARGGAERMAAIRTLQFEGWSVVPGGLRLEFREIRARRENDGGGAIRTENSLQGLSIIQAFDGHSGWRVNQLRGRRDAESMSADEARALADDARIGGALFSARQSGSAVAYLGVEDFDGTPSYKLKVTEKDGDEFVIFLDPDTFLEIKRIETRRLRGTMQVTEVELGDYEKVEGVYFPMSIESWSRGSTRRTRTTILTAKANVEAPEELFRAPGAAGQGGAAR